MNVKDMTDIQFEAHLDVRADLYKQPWDALGMAQFGSIIGVGLLPDDPPWIVVLIRTHGGSIVAAGTTVKLATDAVRHLNSVLNGGNDEPGVA